MAGRQLRVVSKAAPGAQAGSASASEASWVAAASAAGLLIGQQIAAKSLRDALFLSTFSVAELPNIMALATVMSLAVAFATAGWMRRWGPRKLVVWMLAANAVAFVAEWLTFDALPRVIAVTLYLHVASVGALLVSGFWSVVSERYDPHAAKRVLGRIGAGATLGGVLGAAFADIVTRSAGVRAVFPMLAVTSLVGALALTRLPGSGGQQASGPGTDEPMPAGAAPASALSIIRSRPYLMALGLLTISVAVWEAFIDYAMKVRVAEAFPDRLALLSVFSAYYAGMNLLTFVVQAGLCAALLRKAGLTWTVATLPLFVVVFALGSVFTSALIPVVILRGGEGVFSGSFYRAARELYFTPLSKATKRSTKTLLDVAATRLGDGVGTLIVVAIVSVAGVRAPAFALAGAALTAALALVLMPRLDRGYVASLGRALERGLVRFDDPGALDATTRRTLANTTKGMSRAHLLREIARLRRRNVGSEPQSGARAHARSPLRTQASALADASPQRVSDLPDALEVGAVGLAIPLLLEPALADEVGARLERAAGRATGTLADVLLDPMQPMPLRALMPRLLVAAGTARARDALALGLDDTSREVRTACALALAKLVKRNPTLKPVDSLILGWIAGDLTAERAAGAVHLDALAVAFALLSMLVDRRPLTLARRALESQEPAVRGTALEYLENVVDDPARTALLAHLAAMASSAATTDGR